MKTHHLKIWPDFFNDVVWGFKSFEIRLNDRDFRRGDHVCFEEWDPEIKKFTGQTSGLYAIDYITYFPTGLREGYCAFSLRKLYPETGKK